MSVSSRVRNIILAESLGVCALCNKNIGADGEAAHIVAETPDGPRGKSNLTLIERNSPDNLIYLCVSCHREKIDKYPDQYPVADLHHIKLRHQNVRETFNNGQFNYFKALFFGLSTARIASILSNACCGIQIQLSDSDLNNLSQLQKNIETTIVPANMNNYVSILKDAIVTLNQVFEKEGVEFQCGPYEFKYRVMFYNEMDPETSYRRDEFWELYFNVESLCSNAAGSLHHIVKQNSAPRFT
ncbi:HNH endonuclease signature motif containing protein [Vibrio tapetis subsp. quintayensis]|uniref:HNH endonuclease n=1 Tax=Vibrio tapetis TaxID=52443 RepID=UPI0025B3A844|nr:HNH endonuclease signature motif containing protein [Vibrio tapetis]MDN3678828.1 HNH endonuclease signature motif containing protein [Vibrio tapetis subsp. quintayensis]